MEFRLQGEVIRAHSQVLCSRSEVLKKQLNSGMQEAKSKVIMIEDCGAATFKAFLKFLYTDELPAFDDLAAEPPSPALKQDGSRHTSQMEALWAVSHKYQVGRPPPHTHTQTLLPPSLPVLCNDVDIYIYIYIHTHTYTYV